MPQHAFSPLFFTPSPKRNDKQRTDLSNNPSDVKKKTRRGQKNKKFQSLTIYYVNIRGFKSKSDSMKNIIETLKPDIIVICEIKAVTSGTIRTFFKSLGYETIVSKPSGMVIATKVKFDMVNVTTTTLSNIISTSIKIGNDHMTVTCIYGPQETEKEEVRSHFYDELELEVNAALDRGNNLVVIGDFNSKIIMENDSIKELSPNGTLLNDIINRCPLRVLNFEDKTSGKWTRVQEKNGTVERSVIDYAILAKVLKR